MFCDVTAPGGTAQVEEVERADQGYRQLKGRDEISRQNIAWIHSIVAESLAGPQAEINKLGRRIDELVKPVDVGRTDLLKVRQRVEKLDKRLREVESRSGNTLLATGGDDAEAAPAALAQGVAAQAAQAALASQQAGPASDSARSRSHRGAKRAATQATELSLPFSSEKAPSVSEISTAATASSDVTNLQAELRSLRGLVEEQLFAFMEYQKRLQEIASTHRSMDEDRAKLNKRCLALEMRVLGGQEATPAAAPRQSSERPASEMGARSLRMEIEEFRERTEKTWQKQIVELQGSMDSRFAETSSKLKQLTATQAERELFTVEQVELLLRSQRLGSTKACIFCVDLLSRRSKMHKVHEELLDQLGHIENAVMAYGSPKIAMLLNNNVCDLITKHKHDDQGDFENPDGAADLSPDHSPAKKGPWSLGSLTGRSKKLP